MLNKVRKRRIEKIRRRSKPKREPKIRFTLFCEGRNTEPAYFKALEKVCRNGNYLPPLSATFVEAVNGLFLQGDGDCDE
ncbi:MAG: hypothetical protein OXE84_01785, partial [Rhodobacteraceae bacterium]|nr:hypothetical protein [Paracoccaceae bacterium]